MNILVTGASRGIGFELVKYLSRDAANRLIAVSRNTVALEALKKECPSNVEVFTCDLSWEDQVAAFCEKLKQPYKSIDVLINNAGSLVNKPFIEMSLADFRKVYEVNVFGAAGLIQKLMPMLSAAPKAHVVNISSM